MRTGKVKTAMTMRRKTDSAQSASLSKFAQPATLRSAPRPSAENRFQKVHSHTSAIQKIRDHGATPHMTLITRAAVCNAGASMAKTFQQIRNLACTARSRRALRSSALKHQLMPPQQRVQFLNASPRKQKRRKLHSR